MGITHGNLAGDSVDEDRTSPYKYVFTCRENPEGAGDSGDEDRTSPNKYVFTCRENPERTFSQFSSL